MARTSHRPPWQEQSPKPLCPCRQQLAASEQHGRAISGKFEVEDERFQLSVYTGTGESYSEVLMDPRTGSVVKVRRLASGEDLTVAKAQNVALAMARVSLREATERAVNANAGFVAMSVTPVVKDGHPIAEVTLAKGVA